MQADTNYALLSHVTTTASADHQVLEGWSRRPEQATWILSRLAAGHLATSLLVMDVMRTQHMQAMDETRTVFCYLQDFCTYSSRSWLARSTPCT